MYTLRTENDGMFLYAVKDGKTEVDFTDEYAVTAFLNEVNELTAENAKLREQLAEAVSLLESIGYFADIQVTDARDDILEGGTPDDNAERWERIATFLFKRGFYDTTTQETTR